MTFVLLAHHQLAVAPELYISLLVMNTVMKILRSVPKFCGHFLCQQRHKDVQRTLSLSPAHLLTLFQQPSSAVNLQKQRLCLDFKFIVAEEAVFLKCIARLFFLIGDATE